MPGFVTETPGHVILTVGIEIIGVGLMAAVAGTNDQLGSVIVLLMVGFFILFLVNNPIIGTSLSNLFKGIQKA